VVGREDVLEERQPCGWDDGVDGVDRFQLSGCCHYGRVNICTHRIIWQLARHAADNTESLAFDTINKGTAHAK